MNEYIVAVTGASGSIYAKRLVEILADQGHNVHLLFSDDGVTVAREELRLKNTGKGMTVEGFLGRKAKNVKIHPVHNFHTPLASGSYRIDAMIVVPCTVGRIGSAASGICRDLIDRSVECTLKEGRLLIIVPRETPFSTIALENMTRLSRAGACILPPNPGFYHHPESVSDLVDFIVAKILDRLGLDHELNRPYGT